MPYDIIYMWNLKYDTRESVYDTETDSQGTELWLPSGKLLEEGCTRRLELADAIF